MALSKTTRDHDEIRKWAESHGAIPSEVASTKANGEPGILRFQFPKAKQKNDDRLQEISWDDFLRKFDENNPELVYQERTADGRKSNFNKLVHPESGESRSHGSKSAVKSGSKTGAKSSSKSPSKSGAKPSSKSSTASKSSSKKRSAA